MKKALSGLLLLIAAIAFIQPTWARSHSAPNESQLVEHGTYTDRAGESVHSPAHSKNGTVPAGSSAQCGDGSYSFSHSHRGTCSHHGGVAQWL